MPLFTAAAAVFSAISTFIGGLGTVGAFVLKTAVGVGLNLLAQAIAGKPQKPKFSINGTLQRGGDLSRTFIIGKTATAGSLVYANTWSRPNKTPNEYLTQVIALSDYPINGLAELWVNGEKVTLGDLDSAGLGYRVVQYKTGTDDNHMWVKFYDGTQTTADTFLTGSVSSADRPWESSRIGSGVAYAIVTAQITDNLYSGIPSFKFVLNGAKLYDITKDSTVAGGSGPHRWGDYATYGGDGDHLPAVQAYNILRGITWNGKWFYGLQNMSGTRLPSANWISQINKCRATIARASGLEPTYRSGGEIDIESPISDAVEACLTACQGRVSETGGVYKIHVGAPDAPVASITDGDILSTEEQAFTPFFGLSDTINGITATYPSPEENWAAKVAPPLYNTAFEAEDGNRRLMADVPLDFVPYAEQVQQLMKSALEEARRARRHTFVLPPEYWVLEPGDVISFSSVRNGYENKLFRVDGVSDKANLDVMVDITEVDPADYDWNSETDFHPPVDGAVGPMRPAPQPIIDWFAEPDTVDDNAGNPRRPAILLSWDGDQPDVRAVEFEVRNGITLQVQYRNSTDNPRAGSIQISQGLLPNTLYGVRGRYIANSDRETLWSSWLLVTTPDVRLGEDDIYLPGVVDGVIGNIQGNLKWLAESVHYGRDELDRVSQLISNNGSKSAQDKFQLVAELGKSRAEYTREIVVVANATEAAAIRVEQVSASLTNVSSNVTANSAAISTLSVSVTNINGQLTSIGNSITALTASVGNVSANGLFRITVEATPAGALARIGLSVSATAGGATSQASIFLDAMTGGLSRIGMVADQIYMASGGNLRRPFVFQGATLYLDDVKVNTLSALSSTLGNVDISNAIIGNLIVGTTNIGFNAVNDIVVMTGAYTNSTPYTQALNFPLANSTVIQLEWSLTVSSGGGETQTGKFEFTNTTTGAVLFSYEFSTSVTATRSGRELFFGLNAAGGSTYRFRSVGSGQGSATARFMYWKR